MSSEGAPDETGAEDEYRDGDEVTDDYQDRSRLLERRDYLKLAGAAVATVGSAATVSAAGGTTQRGIDFDRVLDAVDDLGLDPTGGVAVNSRLDSALTDGTLVRFPEGEYQFDGELVFDADRIGLLGEGDVRFVPPTGYSGLLFNYYPTPDDVLIENVDIDMRADETTTGIRLKCRNHFHIQDVEYLGRGLTDNSGQVSAFLLGVTNESGRGVLRHAVAKKGSRIDGYARGNGRIGIWVGWSNKGTVRIEDCDFREFGNNGTYTSRTPGQVEIVDSYFLNNNAANVRIGGEGSYVENCTVEIDFEKYTGPPLGDISTGFGMRGIHVDQGVQLEGAEAIPAGAEIRNCELLGKNAPNGIAMVNLSPQGRSVLVKDTRIQVDIDRMWAARRGRPGAIPWREWQRTPPKPHWLRLDNVSITGSASGREAVHIDEADGSTVRNCCIHQSGSNRDGVNFVDSTGGVVENSTIDVTGTAITMENSTVDTASITQEGSCPLPDPDRTVSSSDSTTTTTDSTTTTTTDTQDGKKLVLDGGHTTARLDYTFTVDGSVEAGARANGSDTIDGTTVTGHVEGGIDSFWVTGDFTEFQVEGDLVVRLDGETVEPQNLVERTVEIDGSHTTDRIDYTFSVDGSVEAGARANDSDTIEGTSVAGYVAGGVDSYQVTGDFTNFQVDGDPVVRVDGETVDPDALDGAHDLPHELVVVGGETAASYLVETTGAVAKRGGMWGAEDADTASGATASGSVSGDRDTFGFSGDIARLQVDGDAAVTFER